MHLTTQLKIDSSQSDFDASRLESDAKWSVSVQRRPGQNLTNHMLS